MSSTVEHQLSPQPVATTPAVRLAWIDNARTLMIALVVNMHACVTYSHVGSWYINEQPEPGMPAKMAFVLWQGHLQAFFMGLLFFLAGIFAHRSLTRRGPQAFLKERFVRLGVPALLYMVLIHSFIVYVMLSHPHVSNRPSLMTLYVRYFTSGRVWSGNGPMWFALALLAFCVALVAWRAIVSSAAPQSTRSQNAPGVGALLGFGGVLAVTTFLIRTVQPIGTNVFNFQLCFFPQYIAAFATGVVAGKQGWLEVLVSSRRARVAGWLAIIGGPLVLVLTVWLFGAPSANGANPYSGGWNRQAFALSVWEQFAGLGLGLGVLALFHRRCNLSSARLTWLSNRAFAVYVLHAPVLVGLTFALRPVAADPFTRAALLTITGLTASFLVADIAKRVPGLRTIL